MKGEQNAVKGTMMLERKKKKLGLRVASLSWRTTQFCLRLSQAINLTGRQLRRAELTKRKLALASKFAVDIGRIGLSGGGGIE